MPAAIQIEEADFRQLLVGQARIETQNAEILRRLEQLEKVENKVGRDLETHRREVDIKIAELQKWQYMMMGALTLLSILSPLVFRKLGL